MQLSSDSYYLHWLIYVLHGISAFYISANLYRLLPVFLYATLSAITIACVLYYCDHANLLLFAGVVSMCSSSFSFFDIEGIMFDIMSVWGLAKHVLRNDNLVMKFEDMLDSWGWNEERTILVWGSSSELSFIYYTIYAVVIETILLINLFIESCITLTYLYILLNLLSFFYWLCWTSNDKLLSYIYASRVYKLTNLSTFAPNPIISVNWLPYIWYCTSI